MENTKMKDTCHSYAKKYPIKILDIIKKAFKNFNKIFKNSFIFYNLLVSLTHRL
jgi:endonuclease IV